MPSPTLIKVQDVTVRVGGRTLFTDVSLSLKKGGSYGLRGPNGSGKTVFLQTLLGLIRPTVGTVELHPLLKPQPSAFPLNIGTIIDRPAFIGRMTAMENLQFLGKIRGIANDNDCKQALQTFGLDPTMTTPVTKFSLGMKQKLALAQATFEKPEMLILDEPFNALDDSSVSLVMSFLQTYKKAGKTILFTSHQMDLMEALADTVFKIDNQQVVLS